MREDRRAVRVQHGASASFADRVVKNMSGIRLGAALRAVAIVVLGVASVGCSSQGPAAVAATAATSSETGEYLIGPGDTLEIFVWRQPDLSVTVPVRPDGRISTPLVEDLVATNKTPTELAREIESRLAEYVRSPEVNVIVQSFVGTPGAQVRVLGQATQQRSIPYRERLTLLDVIIEAGGLTEFAAGNRSRVMRTSNGQTREIRVRIDDLLNRGDVEQNILMQPGDIVVIPEAVF